MICELWDASAVRKDNGELRSGSIFRRVVGDALLKVGDMKLIVQHLETGNSYGNIEFGITV